MKVTHGRPASDLPKLTKVADLAVSHGPSFPPLSPPLLSIMASALGVLF